MVEYLTPEQLKELKEKLKKLETTETKKVAEMISEAASFGDLSENAAYSEAKERQAFLQKEIADLKERIRSAKIIQNNKDGKGKIQLGSKILVQSGNEKVKFEIVGSMQADPLKGKISNNSPVGRALLGKSEGDLVEICLGENGKKITYKIIKIE